MTQADQTSFEETWAFRFLLAGAFVMGFSMPAGRLCIALSLLLAVTGAVRKKIRFVMPASAWLWLALFVLAGVVTACGINPHRGLGKLHKLGWYIGIPIAATLVTTRKRMKMVLCSLIGGLTVLSAMILFQNPLYAHAIVRRFQDSPNHVFFQMENELAMQGSIIDGERLMVGLTLALALLLAGGVASRFKVQWHHLAIGGFSFLAVFSLFYNRLAASAIVERFHGTPLKANFSMANELEFQNELFTAKWPLFILFALLAIASYAIGRFVRSKRIDSGRKGAQAGCPPSGPRGLVISPLPCAIALIALAEIVVLKRGSWFCTIAIVVLLLVRRISWKWLATGALALLAVAFLVSPVRARFAAIPGEFDSARGGRAAMWTKFAPAILADHPWGIGFRSLVPDDASPFSLQSLSRKYNLNIEFEKNRDHLHSNLVEMTTSLGWEGLVLYLVWMGVIFADAIRGGKATSPVFWAILALFLNGFVEYNFANAGIIIIFGILAGLAAAGRRLAQASNDGAPTPVPLPAQEQKES